jgi:hypothetical protein
LRRILVSFGVKSLTEHADSEIAKILVNRLAFALDFGLALEYIFWFDVIVCDSNFVDVLEGQ